MSNEVNPQTTPAQSQNQTAVDTSNENHGKLLTQLAQRIRVVCNSCKSVFFKAPHELENTTAFYCSHNPKCIYEGSQHRGREEYKKNVLGSRDPADNSDIEYPDELKTDAEKLAAGARAKVKAAPIVEEEPAEESIVTPSAESAYEDEGNTAGSNAVEPSGHEEPNGEFHY